MPREIRTEPWRNEELIEHELRDKSLDPKDPEAQTEQRGDKLPDDHTRPGDPR